VGPGTGRRLVTGVQGREEAGAEAGAESRWRAVRKTTALSETCFRRIPAWKRRDVGCGDVLEGAWRQYAEAGGGLVEESGEALGCLLDTPL
jgi:hypothetical protein